MSSNILFLIGGFFIFLTVFLMARGVNKNESRNAIDGEKLFLKSANINGINYALILNLTVNESELLVKCLFPKFVIIFNYEEVRIRKCKSLIGTQIEISDQQKGITMTMPHSLAKQIDKLSKNSFDYANL